MQTDALIEGMNALGYKVANLSLRELSHGYDVFVERQKKARFEFVSANVVWQDSGEPIVAPTTVVKATLRDGARSKTVRLGFIGLTRNDPAFLKEGPKGRRIVTVDPLSAAEKQLPALRQKADVMETVKVAITQYNKEQTLAMSPFAAPTPPPAEAAYTGSDRCALCHEQAFTVWAKSSHAHAFQTLLSAHQEYNPKCLPCHTIGFGQRGGYLNPQATSNLIHVGCQACHGPSSRHPEQIEAGFGRIDVSSCVACHTRENSPDYVPAEYIPKVIHWKEAQTKR